MRKQIPTIQDVARAANVSTATVSRALSLPGRVSEDTRRAVIEAVERTGYAVNQTARNLRRKQTSSIVVLVPNLGNPFFSQILAGIEARLSRAGYNVLVADTKHPGVQEERLIDYLHANRADGIIVLDGTLPLRLLKSAGASAPPTIFCCEWEDAAGLPSIRFDNAGGEALAVRHLVERGHSRIGHILGPHGNVLTQERLAGFRRGLAESGLEERADWILEGDFSLRSGAQAARRWLAMSDRPSAITTSSDVMACGFISELHRNGCEVPRDVSVIGFDDIDIAEIFIPALTTIRQPRNEIGDSAAEALLRIVQGSGEDAGGRVLKLWPPELVERESVQRL
ncbi:LacI family DNA-binding transcriptional regulator [Arvimicrobium flavum]|uniref:LacI family DNA-binding transcriptional regulator n=1 Tax=Arvimicrobium flavum TaxID=3393320 RepID=UPI00237A9606|nr:LacI family DNA-binding transcriptional regulator [Mesorhizobium shangrilense]